MFYAAVGGMQLKHWTDYFKIIWPTMRVLRAAKRDKRCVKADSFKAENVFFAVSVWENVDEMKDFAHSGLHRKLTNLAANSMAMFHNHTEEFEEVPNRDQCVAAWLKAVEGRNGKGTIGVLQRV